MNPSIFRVPFHLRGRTLLSPCPFALAGLLHCYTKVVSQVRMEMQRADVTFTDSSVMAPLCICAHPHSLSKLREEAPPGTSVKDVQEKGEVGTEGGKVGAETK